MTARIPQGRTANRTLYTAAVLAVAATAAALDQVSKWVVASSLAPGQSLEVIPGVLELNLRANPHGAFGLFASFPPDLRLPILLALGVVAMFAIVAFSIRTLGWSMVISVSLGLILGGAASNLADRATRGEVLDFIDVYLGAQARWPTFNLADMAITVGSLILIGTLVRSWFKQRHAEFKET